MFGDNNDNYSYNFLTNSNNYTLILNNINYLPVVYQKKLLFHLENDDVFKKYNIKVISITSKNIDQEIKDGNFIRNLFERLNVISIKVPSIIERREDILPICEYYLDYFNKNKKFKFSLSKEAINYIEKTIIINQDFNLNSDYEITKLPLDMGENQEKNNTTNFALSLKEARQNFEKEYLLSQIKRFNGNIAKISEFTGMERTALYRKFKSLNISFNKK